MERGQAERICREALDKPDRHAALRWLRDALPSMDSRLPGLRNEGFLATHELAVGARRLDAWPDAERKARPLLQSQGNTLFHALGFEIEAVDQVTSILRAGTNERKTAVAVLLRQDESPELSTPRFSGLSLIWTLNAGAWALDEPAGPSGVLSFARKKRAGSESG